MEHGRTFRVILTAMLLAVTSVLSCAEIGVKPFDVRSRQGGGDSALKPGGGNSGDQVISPNRQGGETFGQCTRYKVSFTGSRGGSVPAYLFVPSGGVKTKIPAVMLMYGIVGDKESDKVAEFAGVLCERRLGVLTFDVPGRGERASEADGNPAITALDPNLFRWYLADYGAAMNYMTTVPEFDPARIGYTGASWGAITGIVYTASDPRVKALVSVVGGGGFQALLSAVGLSSPELDPVNAIRRVPPRPIMLINAKNDEVILAPFGQALHNAAPTATKIWLDAGHTLEGVDLKTVAGQVADWLQSSLK
jgi:dienelactone hydrolase